MNLAFVALTGLFISIAAHADGALAESPDPVTNCSFRDMLPTLTHGLAAYLKVTGDRFGEKFDVDSVSVAYLGTGNSYVNRGNEVDSISQHLFSVTVKGTGSEKIEITSATQQACVSNPAKKCLALPDKSVVALPDPQVVEYKDLTGKTVSRECVWKSFSAGEERFFAGYDPASQELVFGDKISESAPVLATAPMKL